MTRNDRPRPPYNSTSSPNGSSLLPTHSLAQQSHVRPRSAFGHREDLGRLAARQARRARRAGADHEKGEDYDMSGSDELEMQDHVYSDEERHRGAEERLVGNGDGDADRYQRRKRRRDVDGPGWSEEEEKGVNRFVVRKLLINALFIGLWYFFSISISLVGLVRVLGRDDADGLQYNKWMFKEEKPVDAGDGKEGIVKPADPVFPFPLFTTCAHMLVQFSLAALVMFIFPRFQPWRNPPTGAALPNDNARIDEEGNIKKEPLMTPWFYFSRIAPCGLATGTDIGLGNMSLKFISLTFYSTSPMAPWLRRSLTRGH